MKPEHSGSPGATSQDWDEYGKLFLWVWVEEGTQFFTVRQKVLNPHHAIYPGSAQHIQTHAIHCECTLAQALGRMFPGGEMVMNGSFPGRTTRRDPTWTFTMIRSQTVYCRPELGAQAPLPPCIQKPRHKGAQWI